MNIMYKTDPAMHPNNAAMMVFTSVVVVASFRAAAEGLVKGIIRFDVYNGFFGCCVPKACK